MVTVNANFSRKLAKLTADELNEVELNRLFRAYAMDVICHVVFGMEVDTQVISDYFTAYTPFLI